MGIEVIHGKAEEVVRGFEPGSFDVIATDPPYGVPLMSGVNYQHENAGELLPDTYANGKAALNAGHGFVLGDGDEAKTLATYDWLFGAATQLLDNYGFMYVLLADKMLPRVHALAEGHGWKVRYFAWTKSTVRPPFPGVPWGNGVEMALFCFRKMDMKHRFDPDASAFNYWRGSSPTGPNRVHPTQKPVGLFEHWLRRTPGRLLDPFCGSGSSLVAAQRCGLDAVGIDDEERWVKAARDRLDADRVKQLK